MKCFLAEIHSRNRLRRKKSLSLSEVILIGEMPGVGDCEKKASSWDLKFSFTQLSLRVVIRSSVGLQNLRKTLTLLIGCFD